MKIPSLEQLGKPGIIGLGLLLFCLSFYIGNIGPAQLELERLKSEAARLSAAARPGVQGDARSTTSPRQLPPFSTATDTLKELSTLAEQHGLAIDRATYLLSDKDGQRRLEINLPMKAGYSSLRTYLRAVLAQPAAPSLDELLLQRQQPNEALIDVNLRLSYYFAPP